MNEGALNNNNSNNYAAASGTNNFGGSITNTNSIKEIKNNIGMDEKLSMNQEHLILLQKELTKHKEASRQKEVILPEVNSVYFNRKSSLKQRRVSLSPQPTSYSPQNVILEFNTLENKLHQLKRSASPVTSNRNQQITYSHRKYQSCNSPLTLEVSRRELVLRSKSPKYSKPLYQPKVLSESRLEVIEDSNVSIEDSSDD